MGKGATLRRFDRVADSWTAPPRRRPHAAYNHSSSLRGGVRCPVVVVVVGEAAEIERVRHRLPSIALLVVDRLDDRRGRRRSAHVTAASSFRGAAVMRYTITHSGNASRSRTSDLESDVGSKDLERGHLCDLKPRRSHNGPPERSMNLSSLNLPSREGGFLSRVVESPQTSPGAANPASPAHPQIPRLPGSASGAPNTGELRAYVCDRSAARRAPVHNHRQDQHPHTDPHPEEK